MPGAALESAAELLGNASGFGAGFSRQRQLF
jgi:hypothetical protein